MVTRPASSGSTQQTSAASLLRVAVTAAVSEYVAPPLLDAFVHRSRIELSVQVSPGPSFADLLQDHLADVANGDGSDCDRDCAIAVCSGIRCALLRLRRRVVAHE